MTNHTGPLLWKDITHLEHIAVVVPGKKTVEIVNKLTGKKHKN